MFRILNNGSVQQSKRYGSRGLIQKNEWHAAVYATRHPLKHFLKSYLKTNQLIVQASAGGDVGPRLAEVIRKEKEIVKVNCTVSIKVGSRIRRG